MANPQNIRNPAGGSGEGTGEPVVDEFEGWTVADLRDLAKERGLPGKVSQMRRDELLAILKP